MILFTTFDYITLAAFFAVVVIIGLIVKFKQSREGADYLLGSRKLSLPLFVATTVATWYGGILGVGEFTYKYGILSWITQGLPYYVFALLFAFLLAGKIRESELITIPDKLEENYGKSTALVAAVVIFFLVNPAPYLLMTGSLFSLLFNIPLFAGMLFSIIVVGIYLIKGGFKSTVYTDVFQFFVMFAGFGVIVYVLFSDYGGFDFLQKNIPKQMLTVEGTNPFYIVVWFLIALWTFVDPGFHQRSYAANDVKTAKFGIIISVLFWMLFDFLTLTTGLYSRAILGNNINAVISYPLLANVVLQSGAKGLFFAALFATILSTQNSLTFIAATTFSRDFVYKISEDKNSVNIEKQTRLGILIASLFGFIVALYLQSVVQMWYLFGSILIPGLIFPVIGAYYPRFKVNENFATLEILTGFLTSLLWLLLGKKLIPTFSIEPMIVGLFFSGIIHLLGIKEMKNGFYKRKLNSEN